MISQNCSNCGSTTFKQSGKRIICSECSRFLRWSGTEKQEIEHAATQKFILSIESRYPWNAEELTLLQQCYSKLSWSQQMQNQFNEKLDEAGIDRYELTDYLEKAGIPHLFSL